LTRSPEPDRGLTDPPRESCAHGAIERRPHFRSRSLQIVLEPGDFRTGRTHGHHSLRLPCRFGLFERSVQRLPGARFASAGPHKTDYREWVESVRHRVIGAGVDCLCALKGLAPASTYQQHNGFPTEKPVSIHLQIVLVRVGQAKLQVVFGAVELAERRANADDYCERTRGLVFKPMSHAVVQRGLQRPPPSIVSDGPARCVSGERRVDHDGPGIRRVPRGGNLHGTLGGSDGSRVVAREVAHLRVIAERPGQRKTRPVRVQQPQGMSATFLGRVVPTGQQVAARQPAQVVALSLPVAEHMPDVHRRATRINDFWCLVDEVALLASTLEQQRALAEVQLIRQAERACVLRRGYAVGAELRRVARGGGRKLQDSRFVTRFFCVVGEPRQQFVSHPRIDESCQDQAMQRNLAMRGQRVQNRLSH
jgi:hypothetical protein